MPQAKNTGVLKRQRFLCLSNIDLTQTRSLFTHMPKLATFVGSADLQTMSNKFNEWHTPSKFAVQ